MTDNNELSAFRQRVSNPAQRIFERRVRRLYATVANRLNVAASRGETVIRLPVNCNPRFIKRFAKSQVWNELHYRTGLDGLYWAQDGSGDRDMLVFSREPLN